MVKGYVTYKCTKCKHEFGFFTNTRNRLNTRCPECGARTTLLKYEGEQK